MKKRLIVITIFLLLLIISVYIFIPGKVSMTNTRIVQSSESAALRTLQDINKWQKWWPASGSTDSNGYFVYNNIRYRPEQKFYNGISVLIETENLKLNSRINIFHLGKDTTAVQWTGEFPASLNPIKKLISYNKAKSIRKDMSDILQNLGIFNAKRENIYGITIRESSTKDTILISTKTVYPNKPSQKEIYNLIDSLKKYALAHGSRQNSYPLLNVRPLGAGSYQAMVAIPIDKYIEGSGKIESKRMVPGSFLKAEIIGGESTIDNAFKQMKLYMRDYDRKEVAIPFQVLITDRLMEKDTANWITNIYYPIYN